MKKIREILDVLRDLRFYLTSINNYLSLPENRNGNDKHIATFVADSAPDLQCVFTRIAENPISPIELGEYFVVKIYKRNF